MIDDLLDIIESLCLIMDEETERLQWSPRHPGAAAVVDAKLRLVATLEVRAAQVARMGPDWLESLAPADRDRLHENLIRLNTVSEANRRIIARQIDLSTEMMGVVAEEARRQSGARSTTYGARGVMKRSDMPSPISVNTSL